MKFQILTVIFVMTLGIASPAEAQTRGGRITSQRVTKLCDTSRPRVSVKAATTQTRTIRTQSAADLTSLHNAGGHNITLGLGGGEIGYQTQAKFSISRQGQRACVSLDQLNVTFYAKPQIHIASNFKRGTCEYNAVLAHEQKHIRILRRFHKEYAQKLRKIMPGIVRKVRPSGVIPVSQVSRAQDQILDRISAQISAYLNESAAVLNRRQSAIDNAQEYSAVAARCRNWNKKLAAQ